MKHKEIEDTRAKESNEQIIAAIKTNNVVLILSERPHKALDVERPLFEDNQIKLYNVICISKGGDGT